MTTNTQPFSPPKSFQSAPAKWRTKTNVTSADETLAAECGISPVLAAILRLRGFDDAAAVRQFLAPDESALRDPLTLPDIEPAIARLYQAIENK
jgi:single-stranded-DNA-specific exonuclease